MFGWFGRLFGRKGTTKLEFDLSTLSPSDFDPRPRCPLPKKRYTLRNGSGDQYDVVDGAEHVGHAYRTEGMRDGSFIWCVSVRNVHRDVRSLQGVRDWLKGGDPPLPT